MKLIQKLSISLFAATASILSFSSGAFAGEGGAAGAAAFTIDGTNVTGVAVAASVGKNDASAAAFNNVANNFNSAFALGSSGAIDMQGIGDPDSAAMTGGASDATLLAVEQANELTGNATIQLGTATGNVIATIPGDAAP
jgi:hypothetical protein